MGNIDRNIIDLNNEVSLKESFLKDDKKKVDELRIEIEKRYTDLYKDKTNEIKKFLNLVFSDKLS
jgi:hypothetical protein